MTKAKNKNATTKTKTTDISNLTAAKWNNRRRRRRSSRTTYLVIERWCEYISPKTKKKKKRSRSTRMQNAHLREAVKQPNNVKINSKHKRQLKKVHIDARFGFSKQQIEWSESIQHDESSIKFNLNICWKSATKKIKFNSNGKPIFFWSCARALQMRWQPKDVLSKTDFRSCLIFIASSFLLTELLLPRPLSSLHTASLLLTADARRAKYQTERRKKLHSEMNKCRQRRGGYNWTQTQ